MNATTTKNKAPKYTSSVPGVYFRDDGTTRWVVRFRFQGKSYNPQVIYPVDLKVTDKSHPLHVRKAQEDAEAYARAEKRRFESQDWGVRLLAHEWTFGQLALSAIADFEAKKETGEVGEYKVGSVHHQAWKTTLSCLRVVMGQAKSGHNKAFFSKKRQAPKGPFV